MATDYMAYVLLPAGTTKTLQAHTQPPVQNVHVDRPIQNFWKVTCAAHTSFPAFINESPTFCQKKIFMLSLTWGQVC